MSKLTRSFEETRKELLKQKSIKAENLFDAIDDHINCKLEVAEFPEAGVCHNRLIRSGEALQEAINAIL